MVCMVRDCEAVFAILGGMRDSSYIEPYVSSKRSVQDPCHIMYIMNINKHIPSKVQHRIALCNPTQL